MKAICIDNSNKPEHISEYEWIEEGVVYTITEIVEIVETSLQSNKLGIALKEIELTDASAPYKYYSLERFIIIPETLNNNFKALNEDSLKDLEIEVDIYAENADLTNSI
jgi:hypothetical protein